MLVGAKLAIAPPAKEHAEDARNKLSAEATEKIASGASGKLTLPYTIWTICDDWRQQYQMQISLTHDGKPLCKTALDFGTWPEVGRVSDAHQVARPLARKLLQHHAQ